MTETLNDPAATSVPQDFDALKRPASPSAVRSRGLRLQTLMRLRWLAIIGQSLALITVSGLLDFSLPVAQSFALVAAAVVLNLYLMQRYPNDTQLPEHMAMFLLGFDIVQLAGLLALNGGLENPFAVLMAVPVVVGASLLPPRPTIALGILACALASLLAFWHLPLPWIGNQPIDLPHLYVAGIWLAILCTVAFTAIYVWRVAEEAQTLSDALTATELVLARETHISDIDGLAAAAAHELGTPLSTIALVVKEMQRDAPEGSDAEDLRLLADQVARCRTILRKIGSLGDDGAAPFARQSLGELIAEAASPHRDFGVEIQIEKYGNGTPEPAWRRSPGILYGLGNIIENAVDFARNRVDITARWDSETVSITIRDDGRGIPIDILPRLGQPYLSIRSGRDDPAHALDRKGLGLGIFIAKTLLERSGATISIRNAQEADGGAVITISWPRATLDAAAVN